jgi:hypothetical protein
MMQSFHDTVPRYGYSNDLEDLIVGDSDEKNDYLLGLMAASLGLFCFFLVWMLLIVSFKCLGYQRVGFLSGRRMKIPKPPTPKVSEVSAVSPTAINDETKQTTTPTTSTISSKLSTALQTTTSTEQHNNNSFTTIQTNGEFIKVRKESSTTKDPPFVSNSRVKKRIIETQLRSKYNKVDDSTNNQNLLHDEDDDEDEDGSLDLMASNDQDADAEDNNDDDREQPTTPTTTRTNMEEVDPQKDVVYQQQLQDWRIQVQRAQDRLRRMRITVLFAGTCIIVASVLLVVQGAYSLQQSVRSGADGVSEATTIAGNAVKVIDNFVLLQTEAKASTDELLQEINGESSSSSTCTYFGGLHWTALHGTAK